MAPDPDCSGLPRLVAPAPRWPRAERVGQKNVSTRRVSRLPSDMNRSIPLRAGLAAAALLAVSGGGWVLSLPGVPEVEAPPPIPQHEVDATLAALEPPKRGRPLVAIIGLNDATETTDYLMPYGILRRADVADVMALATEPGPVKLYPALKIEPQATVAEFDAQHPEGADYVIVPAMSRDDDPAVLQWLRSQAAKHAIIIGVCAGAKVVGAAGLLDGKRATTHWYYLDELRDDHPIRYAEDRRFVVDAGVATTTGISASMPLALTLIEAIAGRSRAESVSRGLGLSYWDARHESDAFRFTRPFAVGVIANTIAFWNHEQIGVPLEPGIDEVALALVADAWSRTYRSSAVTFAATADALPTENGMRILPDEVATSWPAERLIAPIRERQPARALDDALRAIANRYGTATAELVAMQLEYPKDRT